MVLLYDAAELLTTNKLSELACLALYLMYEKSKEGIRFGILTLRSLIGTVEGGS
jgi:hypothetical protein